MDTVAAVAIVLLAAAWTAASLWRRLARRPSSSCSSGCDGCALASRGCGAAVARGASSASGPVAPTGHAP